MYNSVRRLIEVLQRTPKSNEVLRVSVNVHHNVFLKSNSVRMEMGYTAFGGNGTKKIKLTVGDLGKFKKVSLLTLDGKINAMCQEPAITTTAPYMIAMTFEQTLISFVASYNKDVGDIEVIYTNDSSNLKSILSPEIYFDSLKEVYMYKPNFRQVFKQRVNQLF